MDYTELLKQANEAFASWTPEEQRRARREQAISFTWGNLALMQGGPKLTREEIGALYDKQHAEECHGS